MKLQIDADACPVVEICLEQARKRGIPVTLYCDTSHILRHEEAETVVVSKGADSADFALVNALAPGDLAVTQDYGLAAMCLSRKARVLRQDGLEAFYEIENKVGTDLNRTHTVIATGGSMVLYPEAMAHLKEGSTVIWRQTPFSQLEKRMPADLYDRGIAVPAGTPLREIYEERCVLYARYADLIVASQDGESDTARLVEDVMRTVGLET